MERCAASWCGPRRKRGSEVGVGERNTRKRAIETDNNSTINYIRREKKKRVKRKKIGES